MDSTRNREVQCELASFAAPVLLGYAAVFTKSVQRMHALFESLSIVKVFFLLVMGLSFKPVKDYEE